VDKNMTSVLVFLCILSLIVSDTDLNAQWQIDVNASEARESQNSFVGLDCVDDRNCIAIGFSQPDSLVGYIHGVWRTRNGGAFWHRQYLPRNPQSVWPIARLRKVEMYDSLTAFIVGDSGQIFYTQDAGESWQQYDSMRVWSYRDVSAVGTNEAVAVGTYSKINLIRIGEPILSINPPAASSFTLAKKHQERVMVFDHNFGKWYTTLDLGQSWDTLILYKDTYNGSSGKSLFDLDFVGTDTGFAVGRNVRSSPPRTHLYLMRTTDAGLTWEPYFEDSMGIGLFGTSIAFKSASQGIVGLGQNHIAYTSNGGRSWQKDSINTQLNVGNINGAEIAGARWIATSAIATAGYLVSRPFVAGVKRVEPSHELFKIETDNLIAEEAGSLRLYDILGRSVAKYPVRQGEVVDLSELLVDHSMLVVEFTCGVHRQTMRLMRNGRSSGF
jgi:photosystem II stability/assembly factor-like uncharacterized protein